MGRASNLRDGCLLKVAATANRSSALQLISADSRPTLDDAARSMLQLLVPHLRRAILIADLLQQGTMKLETYRPTVGTLANPVILTDAAMTIHFANPAALRFLDTSGLVRELGGKLAICNIANRRALEKAVEAAERGDSEIGTHGIGVPLNAAESSYPAVAYVLPIGRTPKRTLHNSASVAVFISSQHGAMPTAPAVMATLFGMTAAEANVAAELYSGGTIVDIATRTGVSENTIKSHAQRIYSKTETRSRSELVSLLSTLAPRISFDQAGQG